MTGQAPRGTSSSATIHLDERGERIYPCRCGETHSGQYAAEDFAHHDCLHDYTLVWLGDTTNPDWAEEDVMCPGCGALWQVRRP